MPIRMVRYRLMEWCTGCQITDGQFHKSRCFIAFGREHQLMWLLSLLVTWVAYPVS